MLGKNTTKLLPLKKKKKKKISDDFGIRHGFGAKASLPLTHRASAVSYKSFVSFPLYYGNGRSKCTLVVCCIYNFTC